MKSLFDSWNKNYSDFHSKILTANFTKKKRNLDAARLEKDFMNLIQSLKSQDITEENKYIKRDIKYLEKISRAQDCYNNFKIYVDSIIYEYNNKKLKKRKPEDNIDKFEEYLFDYKNDTDLCRDDKFNKIIYSLIKYKKCLNLVEKIESNKSDQTLY